MGSSNTDFDKKPTADGEPPKAVAGGTVATGAATDAKSAAPRPAKKKQGFFKRHFGNPESGEVYGTRNDYETEPKQIKEEKLEANQFIWYLGAFVLLILLGYWILG